MTDLTKLTTPFGLLDAETQAALKAHWGPLETFTSDGWVYCSRSSWLGNATYRVKPTPPKPRECWSYGAYIRDTEAEALAFRKVVADDHPGNGYENTPIIHWREVLE